MGPLSMFGYLLMEVAGFGLDVRCNPLVVMRIIVGFITPGDACGRHVNSQVDECDLGRWASMKMTGFEGRAVGIASIYAP